MAAEIDISGVGAGIGSMVTTILGLVVLVAVIIGGYLLVTRTGLLNKRKVNCFVFAKRANGAVEPKHPKGEYLKNGKFEIAYDSKNVDKIEAPSEEFIYPGNTIFFVRTERDTHWPAHVRINNNMIEVEPAVLPAGKMALADEIETDMERFKEQDKFEKYLPYIALIMAGLLLGAGAYLGFADVAKSQHDNAMAINGFTAQLTNMTIVNRVIDTSGNVPNRPPG